MSTVVMWSKSKPDVEFQYGRRLGEFHGMSSQSHLPQCRVLPPGEFNGMSSQSHVSHCRVLPLGELTVMIPEPHATLQGAVTWRNQCHDRATLQGVMIPSTILQIVFRHILFFFHFFIQFGLWRAAAFASSPIHLFDVEYYRDLVIWFTGHARSLKLLPHESLGAVSFLFAFYSNYSVILYRLPDIATYWSKIMIVLYSTCI